MTSFSVNGGCAFFILNGEVVLGESSGVLFYFSSCIGIGRWVFI
ncbi:hypothetical protein [Rubritalea tangerina]